MNRSILKKLKRTPKEFIDYKINQYYNESNLYRIIFIFLNIFTALMSAIIAILTAIIISGNSKYWFGVSGKPVWFLFLTSGISSFTTMSTSFINFFVIKNKYQSARKKIHKIQAQIILYKNETGIYKKATKNRNYLLYKKIFIICGNKTLIQGE